MKSSTLFIAAISLAFPLTTLAAEHGHHEHGAAPQKIELNAGKKWPTDEPLRKGMSTIRDQVAAALPQAHTGKLSAAQYEQLGQDINTQIAYMVQNCKLDQKADAQLHVVIGELAQAAEALEGRGAVKNREHALVSAAKAANVYGKYFDHAGWTPVKVPH